MKILIADDDVLSLKTFKDFLSNKYSVICAENGKQAIELFYQNNDCQIAILDWLMPEQNGIDVCKTIRKIKHEALCYIIIITGKGDKKDIVEGLSAGANDYLIKPFSLEELEARINVGIRIITLENNNQLHIERLNNALSQIKTLEQSITICSYCKNIKIQDNSETWEAIEKYIEKHSDSMFSHGICPKCLKKEMDTLKNKETS